MKLLEAQPEVAPGTPPESPEQAPQTGSPAPEGATRACRSCGAAMEPGQDWCLACGAAAAPLSERAGWRSAMTVIGLTLVLLAGAVAASYAALSEDTGPQAPAASSGPVAAVPPATTAAPPPVATTTTPATTSSGKLPTVSVPSNRSTPAKPSPVSPGASKTPASKTPASPSTGTTKTPGSKTPAVPAPGTGTGTGSGTGTTTTPGAPVPIDLAADAATVYDPYGRAAATGVASRALDGDPATSWYVDPRPGAPQVAVGFAIELGQERGIRSIDVTTPTPGFKVEIYATDEATPPPNILDTRWAHITDKADVGSDASGKTHIVLGAGTSKYRTLLLWITQPPADAPRVRISELKIFG